MRKMVVGKTNFMTKLVNLEDFCTILDRNLGLGSKIVKTQNQGLGFKITKSQNWGLGFRNDGNQGLGFQIGGNQGLGFENDEIVDDIFARFGFRV